MPSRLLTTLLELALRAPRRTLAVHLFLLLFALGGAAARLVSDAGGPPTADQAMASVYDNSLRAVWGDRPEVRHHADMVERYGSDELVLQVVEGTGRLAGADLARIAATVDGTPAAIQWMGSLPYAPESLAFGDPPTEAEMADFRTRLAKDPTAERLLHEGPEGWSVALATVLPVSDDGQRAAELGAIAAGWQDLPEGWRVDAVGTPTLLAGVRSSILDTLKRTFPLVNGMVVLLCALVFRSPRRVALVMAAVLQGEALALSAFIASGHGFDYISAFMPTTVVVVGFAANIHLFTRYVAERGGLEPADALRAAAATVARPCAVSVTTTGVALLTLGLAAEPAIARFGVFSALGMVLVLLSAFSLAPALVVLFDGEAVAPLRLPSVAGVALWSFDHPGRVFMGTCAVTLLAVVGLTRLDVGSNFAECFHGGHPVTASLAHVEARFPAFVPYELDVRWDDPPTDGGALLRQADALAERLAQVDVAGAPLGRSHVFGPPAVARAWCLRPGKDALCVDGRPTEAIARALIDEGAQPEGLTTWRQVDGAYEARFTAFMPLLDADVGASVAAALEDAGGPGVSVRATGLGPSWSRMEGGIVWTLWRSFGLGALLVVGLMAVALRDGRALVVSLVPNMLPLLWTIGGAAVVCAGLGIQFNSSAMMFLTVSIGIVVDDTLFFLLGLRRAHGNGLAGRDAVAHVMEEAGPGILLTSVCLAGGFATLGLAALTNVRMMGLLCASTILLALAMDVFVLPALARFAWPPPSPERLPIVRGPSAVVFGGAIATIAVSFVAWGTGQLGWAGHLLATVPAFFLVTVVAHDAVHGAAHGDKRFNRWVGEAACTVQGVPWPIFRKAHLLHHGKTMKAGDPDLWCHHGSWQLPLRWATGNLNYYRVLPLLPRSAWVQGGVQLGVMVAAAVFAPRLFLLGWLVPAQAAIFVFAVFTAWLPHGVFGISVDVEPASTPSRGSWALQLLTLFHEDHHRRPAYPFHQYPALFVRRVAARSWV